MDTGFLYRMASSMTFFWIAFAGVVMLCVSFLFGGHDHDVDHDVDHDHHGFDHGENGGNMRFTNLKVMWMFTVGFGAGGFFAAQRGATVSSASLWGLLGGFILGALGYMFLNALHKRQGSSLIKTERFIGSVGVVDTAIRPGSVGLVQCCVDGKTEWFQARTDGDQVLPANSRVLVTDAAGTVLVVEPETKL